MRVTATSQIIERNFASAREHLRTRKRAAGPMRRLAPEKPIAPAAAPALGTTRTWNDLFNNAAAYERFGATVFGGMARGNVPDGFGLPSIDREGYVLDSLDSTPTRQPNVSTPAPLSNGNLATVHTYNLDVIGAGQTVYRREAVQVPAGATLIVVIQDPPAF